MTVIAFDGKIIAADRQSAGNGTIHACTKLFRFKNVVLGSCGSLAAGLTVEDWYRNGAKKDNWPFEIQNGENWAVLVVVSKQKVVHYEKTPYPIINEDPFTAYGSGSDLAIGAMAAGADAIKAVEIASRWETSCGGGIDWFEISKLGKNTCKTKKK